MLTAEKKRKPDGNGYILVRRATFSEEQELFASDEDEDGVSVAQASSVADEGAVTRTEVYRVLAFFIDIEPEPDDVDTEEEYAALMEHHRGQIEAGYKTLRAYAEQIEVKTLSNMQEVYYSLTNDPRYLGRPLWISVVTAVLNRAWDGVGEWHR